MQPTSETQQNSAVTIVPPGQGAVLSDRGAQVVVKASSQDTLVAFTMLEYTLPPGPSAPPLHLHRLTYEVLHVLQGELTLRMGAQTQTVSAGSLAFVPLGVAHAFSNPSDAPVRFLCIMAPGGYEGYLQELARLQWERGALLPPEEAQELAERYDIEPA